MDRNTITGFSLIFLILIGYYWYTAPSAEEQAIFQRQRDSVARVEAAKVTSPTPSKLGSAAISETASPVKDSALLSTIGGFASQLQGKPGLVQLKSKELSIDIRTKGGNVGRVVLNNHRRSDSTVLELLSNQVNDNQWAFELYTANGPLNSADFYWNVVSQTENQVTLRLGDSARYIDQIYSLAADGFTVKHELKLKGIDEIVKSRNSGIKITWRAQLQKQEKDMKWETQNTTVVYRLRGEDADKLDLASPANEELKNNLDWFGFKQQYFSVMMVADSGFSSDAKIAWKETKDTNRIKDLNAEVYVDFERQPLKSYGFSYYFGPNQFYTMKDAQVGMPNAGLESIIPLGWGIFGWVNRYAVIPVFHALDGVIGSMGIIILLLTVIIKTALLPLVYKSYISTAKMRILKPEIDVIKEKHGSDMQKMQQENMALYRKAGVSPMSGCVPVLLQMPILFAMFQFFPNAFELRQKAFMWATDLSQYDGPHLGFTIPFYGDHVSFFTILMTVSTLIYTHFNNQLSGVTGQMKYIGYFMPVIFLGVLNDYAAGLTWYYFVSNMITFGQQWVIRRTVDDTKLHAQIAENRKKPATKSKFQQRMEEAMKASQQRANTAPKGKKR
jgi:YidC/Oxa1 family membrane protein insertase